MGKRKTKKTIKLKKINKIQQNNLLVNELDAFDKKNPELEKEKRGVSMEGEHEKKHNYIKKTRLISKKQKKIKRDIMELKNANESSTQKTESQNDIELKRKNTAKEIFEFMLQQYIGPLSFNFVNIFSDIFSTTHIKKAYYLLASAYNFFFSKDKMIASIILFAFEHANEVLNNIN